MSSSTTTATTISPSLAQERAKASFPIKQLTYLLFGDENKFQRYQQLRQQMEQDPIFDNQDKYYLDRTNRYKRALQKAVRLVTVMRNIARQSADGVLKREEIWALNEVVDEPTPFDVHNTMFVPALEGQADDEQKAKWLSLAKQFRIIGTYAQTELGHGTFLRGIETTATYDVSTQEFVLHTPTTSAMKWWPGGLGKTATHCVLMAKLIINGRDYGMHGFILQLRSLEDHKPLVGITVGDIGPKFGYVTNDNGYLKLNQVRIPRNQMLMRYAKVAADGTYSQPPHAKVAYGTMLYVRAMIVIGSYRSLARAVTIAVRYSAVRHQGLPVGTGEELSSIASGNNVQQNIIAAEVKLLDYRLQQYRLLPLVATAYVLNFTGRRMDEMYTQLMREIAQNNFNSLAEVHATTAGLKAFCTWMAAAGIEESRKCCGGQGYMLASGLPTLFADYVPSCTYEGDNAVLTQQTARFLMRTVSAVFDGKGHLPDSVRYLEKEHLQGYTAERCHVQSAFDWLSPQHQLLAFRHRATRLIMLASKKLRSELKAGREFGEAWDRSSVELMKCSAAHCYYFMVESCHHVVHQMSHAGAVGTVLLPIVKRLCDTFVLNHIEQNLADFIGDNYLTPLQATLVRVELSNILEQLRPDAVALVDAFDFTDRKLNSAIGRYDGNVYEALYESTKQESLNIYGDVPPGYHEYLQPLLRGKL